MEEFDEAQEEERSQKSLRNVLIIYAVVEALILIPLVIYLALR